MQSPIPRYVTGKHEVGPTSFDTILAPNDYNMVVACRDVELKFTWNGCFHPEM